MGPSRLWGEGSSDVQAGSGLDVQPPPRGHLYGLQEWDLGVLGVCGDDA